MASANSLQQLAINMIAYLSNIQGQGRVTSPIIAQAIGCNPADIIQVAAFIRDSIPGIPLVGMPDGYELTMAWEPNRKYALMRIRTVITQARRLDSGHLTPMLRNQQTAVANGTAVPFTQQEEFLLQQSRNGMVRSVQDMRLLEAALR